MAITCPKCGAEFDAMLFQFGHDVRCRCGAKIEYPGTDLRAGHVIVQGADKTAGQSDHGGMASTLGRPPHDSKQAIQIARQRASNLSPIWIEPGSLPANGQIQS